MEFFDSYYDSLIDHEPDREPAPVAPVAPFRTTGTRLPPCAEWVQPGVFIQHINRRWIVKTHRTGTTGATLEPGKHISRERAQAAGRAVWVTAGN